MNSVIHWNEKALGSHVFPILIPPSGPENPSLLILSEQPIQPNSTICKNQYQRYLITGYCMPGTEICSGNGKENTTDAFWGQIAFDMIPSPVLLPGESYGQRSLVGYSPWDHKRVRYDLATKQQQQQLAKSDLGVWQWAVCFSTIKSVSTCKNELKIKFHLKDCCEDHITWRCAKLSAECLAHRRSLTTVSSHDDNHLTTQSDREPRVWREA